VKRGKYCRWYGIGLRFEAPITEDATMFSVEVQLSTISQICSLEIVIIPSEIQITAGQFFNVLRKSPVRQ
jgi:hypothetical protein